MWIFLFVCHNVFPHERFLMDKFLTKRVLLNGNYFIVQSKQDEADLIGIKKDAIYQRTVHPTYNVFKLQNLTKEAGRKQLGYGEKEKLLLFFGFVREYKGLKYLLKALPEVVEQLTNTKLLVVGDFAGNKENYLQLISELKINDYVDIYDGYIPDKEVEKFFVASDLVVLPYESATKSGIVQIAYGFEKPVIVTNVGGLPEVVVDGKTGYVVEALSHEQLSRAIVKFFQNNVASEFKENVCKEADKYSWERMVDIINKF